MGRPFSKDPLIYKTVGLTQSQWEFVQLWHNSTNPGAQLRELLARAIKFWPAGPAFFRKAKTDKIDDSGWEQQRLA